MASAGLFFRLPLVEHVEAVNFLDYCSSRAIRIFRTDAREGVLYTEADLRLPCAILLGNEGSGMTGQELFEFPSIRIPMAEGVESLNVAIAAAIILFEASRQRRDKPRKQT